MCGQALGSSLEGIAAEMTPAVTRAEARFMRRRCSLAATVAVTAHGLAKSPPDYLLLSQANALAAHPVYGAKTELGRRVVWAIL